MKKKEGGIHFVGVVLKEQKLIVAHGLFLYKLKVLFATLLILLLFSNTVFAIASGRISSSFDLESLRWYSPDGGITGLTWIGESGGQSSTSVHARNSKGDFGEDEDSSYAFVSVDHASAKAKVTSSLLYSSTESIADNTIPGSNDSRAYADYSFGSFVVEGSGSLWFICDLTFTLDLGTDVVGEHILVDMAAGGYTYNDTTSEVYGGTGEDICWPFGFPNDPLFPDPGYSKTLDSWEHVLGDAFFSDGDIGRVSTYVYCGLNATSVADVPVPVPEPASISLISTGLIAFASFRSLRKRRRGSGRSLV